MAFLCLFWFIQVRKLGSTLKSSRTQPLSQSIKKSCQPYLPNISQSQPLLTTSAAASPLQAAVSSPSNYPKSLLLGPQAAAPALPLYPLLNSAASLIMSLPWLPIHSEGQPEQWSTRPGLVMPFCLLLLFTASLLQSQWPFCSLA